ncbi:acyl-CoA dehydrogenase [Baekduia soli]|uniref:Acyl-CoA dehydrogenase n=1 Tax=Baekduia soli TaxID=496014 RepID=A0A5B8U518_9ACTN|nr:acyl-CoA dehydrogenase family protein [Baekduia soli]QEC48120.1 acyl-CoA dehydrogenase [Baekduia soli]
MDFEPSDRAKALLERVRAFLDEHVYPNEREIEDAIDAEVDRDTPFPAVLVELRAKARAEGLWNLALPDERLGSGLSNLDYGVVSEEIGRATTTAPYVFNVQPPDSGNMEILVEHATPEQREKYTEPLLDGDIRSCYAMTEPDTAGSDPTGLACSAVLDGDEWVINGRKWWCTNALGARFAIVMAVTDPDGPKHSRATMLLVPTDTPGFQYVRPLSNMGHTAGPGHWELAFEDCRVPAGISTLGGRGNGFKISQDRLGPGRIHHCMRLIGVAERALELMCARAKSREMFGSPLSDRQFIQDFIATSRAEIDQARLVTWHAAWKLDQVGNRAAREELSITKLVVPTMGLNVVDRAIQVYGGAGVSEDTPLSWMYRYNRMLRIGDGADEVHKMVIARMELAKVKDPEPTTAGAR